MTPDTRPVVKAPTRWTEAHHPRRLKPCSRHPPEHLGDAVRSRAR